MMLSEIVAPRKGEIAAIKKPAPEDKLIKANEFSSSIANVVKATESLGEGIIKWHDSNLVSEYTKQLRELSAYQTDEETYKKQMEQLKAKYVDKITSVNTKRQIETAHQIE